LFEEPWPSVDGAWVHYPGLSAEGAARLAFHVCQSMESEAQEKEARRLKAEQRARPKGGRGERGSAGVHRAVKRFCKRQFRQGRALVSRLRPGPKPKPGLRG
jgi:hypothetical protein